MDFEITITLDTVYNITIEYSYIQFIDLYIEIFVCSKVNVHKSWLK